MRDLYHPRLVSEKILFLDGLSRAGKFLLGKLVSHFDSVEYFQTHGILEHLPFLSTKGVISRSNALALFKLYTNNFVYDRFVGRNINQRRESSGIQNAIDQLEYLNRGLLPDGQAAVTRALDLGRIPAFLVHECLANIDFIIKAVEQARIINIQRHPMDLIFSWNEKGWGERWGFDNLAFVPTFEISEEPYPWFAEDWTAEWFSLRNSPADRVAKAVVILQELEDRGLRSCERHENIYQFSYEKLVTEPDLIVDDLSRFLRRSPYSNMRDILKRENCPDLNNTKSRQSRVIRLQEILSQEYYEVAVKSAIEYDKKWDCQKVVY